MGVNEQLGYQVEFVREALPGEACQDGDMIAEDDFIPCEEPASVVLRVRVVETGEENVAEFCARHADPLLNTLAADSGDDLIL